MKTNIKQRWLQALRSGELPQGQGALRSESESGENLYCCLGVLCKVVDDGEWEDFDCSADRYCYEDTKGVELLPPQLVEDVGLGSRDPEVRVETEDRSHKRVSLTTLNDGIGDCEAHSFEEIADLIENNHL